MIQLFSLKHYSITFHHFIMRVKLGDGIRHLFQLFISSHCSVIKWTLFHLFSIGTLSNGLLNKPESFHLHFLIQEPQEVFKHV